MGTLSLNLHNLNLFFLYNPNSTPQNPKFSHQNPNFLRQNPSSSISFKNSILNCSKSTQIPALSPPIYIKRATKTQAQRALFEYLHYTQNYTFSDAEFISKNSPHFIDFLISKINILDDGDVFRALSRYLMYHPINEFEPFLESLGINHTKLEKFIPKGCYFLCDDSVLVDNFHVLCYHGVPRNRMAKIYTEAREIFGYGNGVLEKKFLAYEDLGLSKSSLIKLFVCCPLLLVGDVDSEFVVVLDWLKRIGIESKWFVNCMSSSNTYSWKRMIETLEFFHQVGYSEKHMCDLFKADPNLLLEGLGRKLYLFLGRFIKSGVDVNVVCSCFIEHSDMFSRKRVENLMSVISFLYNIRMEQDDIAHVLSNYMHILSKHSIKGYRAVCMELGVPKADLCRIINDDPLELISLACKQKHKRSGGQSYCVPLSKLEKTAFLLKLGYIENSEEMEEAVKLFPGRGDQLQERLDCLVEAGLDCSTAIRIVKRVPKILELKRNVIQKKIDFLKNTLGYPIECLVRYPTYFLQGLDRISARVSMYEWLKERNAVSHTLSLSTIVSYDEKRFVEIFVNMHPEGPTIWQRIKTLSNKDKNYQLLT